MEKDKAKEAMVAAVAAALKYRQKNPKASDEEVISYVVKFSNEIIHNMR